MINNLYDYIEAGFRVFGIHGVDKDGNCKCGFDKCQAPYKHPVISKWQTVPRWSDEQLETFDQLGHFDTGFGVLCEGWLVVDVDARNGGVDSFRKLCHDAPEMLDCGFVVNTGSGGGSQHYYFRMSEPTSLVQKHDKYPGIDFKTSGFVIGAGSSHASGMDYEADRGFPQDIGQAPASLLEILKKPDFYRVSTDQGPLDVDETHIVELMRHISPDCGYDQWIKCGMAIHHILGGHGFEHWDNWSQNGDSYPGHVQLDRHWQSFGKSPNPVGYGTLLHYAREGGYCESVTFEYDERNDEAPTLDTSTIDLKRPPGFVGELAQWINDNSLYPRESLAVGAALCAVSSLAGMRHVDELDDMAANLIVFGVAGSGTGKEAIQQAYLKILRAAGVQSAVHGNFKSEQEIMRNLVRHQAALYCIDELGLVLRKLENANKKGGASYLEGIVGLIMSVYSKANGYLPITGDLKQEIRDKLRNEVSQVERRLDDLPADDSADGQRGKLVRQSERLQEALDRVEDGLDSPYMTIMGYTTPVTFDALMGYEQATNGFMARAMILKDLETNPKRKKGFKKQPMSMALESKIRNLYAPGVFSMEGDERVEFCGEKTAIPTTPEAEALLADVYERFYEMAEEQKGATGLEAIPRRGYELAAKVSFILAMPSGLRTAEHVLWAYALAHQDVEQKISLAFSNEHGDEAKGIAAKILSLVSEDHGETLGVLKNRLKRKPAKLVEQVLAQMVDAGMLLAVNGRHAKKKSPVVRYYKTSALKSKA